MFSIINNDLARLDKIIFLDAAQCVVLFLKQACGKLMLSLGLPGVHGHGVGDPWSKLDCWPFLILNIMSTKHNSTESVSVKLRRTPRCSFYELPALCLLPAFHLQLLSLQPTLGLIFSGYRRQLSSAFVPHSPKIELNRGALTRSQKYAVVVVTAARKSRGDNKIVSQDPKWIETRIGLY